MIIEFDAGPYGQTHYDYAHNIANSTSTSMDEWKHSVILVDFHGTCLLIIDIMCFLNSFQF